MNATALLDTDLLVDLVRGFPPTIQALKVLADSHTFRISIISAMELLIGARDKTDLAKAQLFLQRFELLPLSSEIGQSALQLMVSHRLKTALSLPDALIAATALTHAVPLYTRNTKHFSFIPDLQLPKLKID